MKYFNSLSRKTATVLSLALLLVSFTGCKDKSPDLIDDITVDQDNYTVIRTNNYGNCGYTIRIDTDDLASFLSDKIETEVVKVSGYSKALYGMYFNGSLNSQNQLDNFCSVLINTEGSYMIIKCIDGTYYALNGSGAWITTAYTFASSDLVQGYNKSNVIRVKVTGANTYELYLNDVLAKSFTESDITTGLKKGFMFDVDTKANEGFPDSFLEIKFKELSAL